MDWSIDPDDPILSMDSKVLLDGLAQLGASDVDEAYDCNLLFTVIQASGETVADFLDYGVFGRTLARAMALYIPDEGAEHDTCVRIAEDANKRLAEVRMCSSFRVTSHVVGLCKETHFPVEMSIV